MILITFDVADQLLLCREFSHVLIQVLSSIWCCGRGSWSQKEASLKSFVIFAVISLVKMTDCSTLYQLDFIKHYGITAISAKGWKGTHSKWGTYNKHYNIMLNADRCQRRQKKNPLVATWLAKYLVFIYSSKWQIHLSMESKSGN